MNDRPCASRYAIAFPIWDFHALFFVCNVSVKSLWSNLGAFSFGDKKNVRCFEK